MIVKILAALIALYALWSILSTGKELKDTKQIVETQRREVAEAKEIMRGLGPCTEEMSTFCGKHAMPEDIAKCLKEYQVSEECDAALVELDIE